MSRIYDWYAENRADAFLDRLKTKRGILHSSAHADLESELIGTATSGLMRHGASTTDLFP